MLGSEIEAFVGALMFERSLAANTCESYGRDLARFAAYLAGRGLSQASEVTEEHIRDFLESERAQGMSPATRERRTAAIRGFFRFLVERHRLAIDPAALVESARRGVTLPRILSEEETFRMLDAIAGTEPRELRDRALLEVMYGCGLRVSETCDLRMDSIVSNGELLRVFGKGSKERVVPLGKSAGAALNRYFESARDCFTRGNVDETHVFVTRLAKPFTRQGVFKVIRERAAAVGIAPDRVSPHVLRHCCASHMLSHGADIRAIQELLGHADIGTTQIYTHVDVARFSEIHRRFHPRA